MEDPVAPIQNKKNNIKNDPKPIAAAAAPSAVLPAALPAFAPRADNQNEQNNENEENENDGVPQPGDPFYHGFIAASASSRASIPPPLPPLLPAAPGDADKPLKEKFSLARIRKLRNNLKGSPKVDAIQKVFDELFYANILVSPNRYAELLRFMNDHLINPLESGRRVGLGEERLDVTKSYMVGQINDILNGVEFKLIGRITSGGKRRKTLKKQKRKTHSRRKIHRKK